MPRPNSELADALLYEAEPIVLNTPLRTLLEQAAERLRRDGNILNAIAELVTE